MGAGKPHALVLWKSVNNFTSSSGDCHAGNFPIPFSLWLCPSRTCFRSTTTLASLICLSFNLTQLLGSPLLLCPWPPHPQGSQSPAHSGNIYNTWEEGEARCWRRKWLTQFFLGSLSFKLKCWGTYSPYEPILNSFMQVMTIVATGMSPIIIAWDKFQKTTCLMPHSSPKQF